MLTAAKAFTKTLLFAGFCYIYAYGQGIWQIFERKCSAGSAAMLQKAYIIAALLLVSLLLSSCDKDDRLRLAVEDSPNAKCLKNIFAKDSNFKLVNVKKADILVSLDSSLNYKNGKNGKTLKYMRQQTIFGDAGYCSCKAILGYEIDICDFAKRHASYLAKLSAEEWSLDSNANGETYISGGNRNFGRQAWIAQLLTITENSIIFSREGWYGEFPNKAEAIDNLAKYLTTLHISSQNMPGLEDIYLGSAMFIYSPKTTSFGDLARITSISRKAGYSNIIYGPTLTLGPDTIETSDIDKAKELLNSLYHKSYIFRYKDLYQKHKKNDLKDYFNSYIANQLSLEGGYLGWDFVYSFQDNLTKNNRYVVDFETKSIEPIQIIAKITKWECPCKGIYDVFFKNGYKSLKISNVEAKRISIYEVLFSFEKEKGSFKISDIEAKGISLKKRLAGI
jgi:hypothetical protein